MPYYQLVQQLVIMNKQWTTLYSIPFTEENQLSMASLVSENWSSSIELAHRSLSYLIRILVLSVVPGIIRRIENIEKNRKGQTSDEQETNSTHNLVSPA